MPSIPQDLTRYADAVRDRLIDRPRCDFPEIAITGEGAFELAAKLRRAGIATATYLITPRRQLKRALREDPDYILNAETMAIRCCHTDVAWFLNRDDPVTGALFAVNCGYLPLDWDRIPVSEAA